MSMSSAPSKPFPPPLSLKAWLTREARRWVERSLPRSYLLILLSFVLFVLSPLLPITAFLLWLWASHTIFWHDRWTTIWIWAKKCGAFIAFLVTLAFLNAAHVSIIPQVITALQTLWHTYLPGELSLSPLDTSDLLIRTLLWLPLAPALTLCYEYLDPRTEVDPRPILTPADLTKPAPPPAAIASAPPSPIPPQQAHTTPPTTPSSQPRAKRPKSKVSPQQMTIESALGEPMQGNEATPSPSPKPRQKQAPSPQADTPQPPTAKKTINWNDVAE